MFILFIIISLFLIIVLAVSASNLFFANEIKESEGEISGKSISILIPARNEEKNIKDCISSIMNQDYDIFEIIVLNDNSNDNTLSILNELASTNKKLKVINGEALKQGWLGKNYACHQLSREAKGEYFLFIDADVRLNKEAVSSAVKLLENSKDCRMVSVFPTQVYHSFGEKLIVPLMNWILLSFLPLRLVYKSPNKSFIAANGQFILIDSEVYRSIGGHESVKDKVVEDMELARKVKSRHRMITAVGGEQINCKMYDSLTSAYNGFSKNFFPGFNTSVFAFILLLLLILTLFLLPIILVFLDINFIISLILILLNRFMISRLSRQNTVENIFLHPFQMMFLFAIGINSIIKSKTKSLVWKERKI